MTQPQKSLFDDLAEPWEADDAQWLAVATVVFAQGPTQEFDYLVPDALQSLVEPGRRVKVPFGAGNQTRIGYCVRLATRTAPTHRLKPIRQVLDHQRLLSPAMLRLTEWIAERYLCPWGQVLETVLPAGVREQSGTRLKRYYQITDLGREALMQGRLPPKQAEVLRQLGGSPLPLEEEWLCRAARTTTAPLEALIKKQWAAVEKRRQLIAEASPGSAAAAHAHEAPLELNADQQQALAVVLEALRSGEHRTVLLHGITGSGKTEVYLRAVAEVQSYGRQAIVLVPEISLTPQTQQRFRARFGDVAVLHSHLSDVERHAQWQRIAQGQVRVIVGARSAIFAPTPHLGLIVMDEEHEASFKQDSAPRYHTRDVAIQRALAEDVPLVLGSATPSLETWQRAQQGQYLCVELPRRVNNLPLPPVRIVDLRSEVRQSGHRGCLSRPLHLAIRQTLEEGHQVILLLNRRGFATHIQCPACGQVMRCPSCAVALTHHHRQEIALCHYCDYQVPAPARCPECNFAGLRYSGLGTQRLEAEVRSRFPDAPCLRMDTDTMQKPGSHERALEKFRSGEIRILLGTQMIAKGLDFPQVTLVGVVQADLALHLPDFRAAERTFQLVVQVAGRSGRGPQGGRVLVQTFSPEHPAIRFAAQHDYQGFAAEELVMRRLVGYPPFASLVRLVIRGPHEATAWQFAQHLAERLNAAISASGSAVRILGPAPAPLSKLRDNYRFQLQLQADDAALLRTVVRQAAENLRPPAEVQWMADVDPLDML